MSQHFIQKIFKKYHQHFQKHSESQRSYLQIPFIYKQFIHLPSIHRHSFIHIHKCLLHRTSPKQFTKLSVNEIQLLQLVTFCTSWMNLNLLPYGSCLIELLFLNFFFLIHPVWKVLKIDKNCAKRQIKFVPLPSVPYNWY